MLRRDIVLQIDPPQSGEINMQVDEQLLAAAQPDGPIVIRIYRWLEPTLSLGHFQSVDEREGDANLSSLPYVRRKTGGGAIVHDKELTYSIIVPESTAMPLKGHSDNLYRSVHLAVRDALRMRGLNADLSESCTCNSNIKGKSDPFLCFLRRSPVDLILESCKILGSAQRRTRQGLLQHGSLLLARSSATPQLLGICDIAATNAASASGVYQSDEHWSDLVAEHWIDWFVQVIQNGVEHALECNDRQSV